MGDISLSEESVLLAQLAACRKGQATDLTFPGWRREPPAWQGQGCFHGGRKMGWQVGQLSEEDTRPAGR